MVQELMIGLFAPLLMGAVGTDLVDVAQRLRAFRESWSSIEVRARQDLVDHMRHYAMPIYENYVETALGQRMLELAYVAHNTGRPSRFTWYCDGDRCADVAHVRGEPESMTIKRSFMTEGRSMMRECGSPLSYLYLMHRPLDTFLPRGSDLGRVRRLGRHCVRVVIKDVQWTYSPAEMTYDMDLETGFPLAVSCFASQSDRDADQPAWTWEANSFDKVDGGRFFPMNSTERLFILEGGRWSQMAKREIRVLAVKFNQEYPASMFWPETRPGSTVWDQIANVSRQVPGLGRSPTAEPAPVRVEPPADWTTWLPWAALVLGLLALGGGLFLRWHQTRAA